MAEYHNMAPAEWDKQSSKFKKKWTKDEWARRCLLQPKYDGVNVTIDVGNRRALSRTGEVYTSMEHIVQAVCAEFADHDKVYLEAWAPITPHPVLNGWARRYENSPRLRGVVFDAVHVEDTRSYATRLATIHIRLRGSSDVLPLTPVAYFIPSQEHTWEHVEAIAKRRKQDAHSAFDGVIIADPDAVWRPGKTKNGEVIKIKPTLSLDLEVVDIIVEPGEKTGRLVAVLVVSYRGIRCKVGSGVPHDLAGINIGSIVEVEALGVTEKGLLREPRFKGLRTDKPKPD